MVCARPQEIFIGGKLPHKQGHTSSVLFCSLVIRFDRLSRALHSLTGCITSSSVGDLALFTTSSILRETPGENEDTKTHLLNVDWGYSM